MKDGFLKAAAFSPALRVADCTYNAQQILEQLQAAAQRGVKLAVFPEFCLTGYTCGDLFLQRTLQQGALDALEWLLAQTRTLDTVALVGLPLLVHGIGEPATSIVAPAITNAMSAALGARIDTLPADLETVRAILDEKKR